MMKNIIVPTDFSDFSEHAADYACELAIAHNVEVLLLHTYCVRYGNSGAFLDYSALVKDTSLEYLQNEKQRLLAKYPQLQNHGIRTQLLFQELDVAISSLENTGLYSCIVIGSKGKSAFKELFIGSQTARLVEECKLPLVIIPEKFKYIKSKDLLFPIDLEDELKSNDVTNLLPFMNAETAIHLYHNYADYTEMDEKNEKRIINHFHATFNNSIDLNLQFHTITINAIEKYAKEVGADFIVVRKKQKGFIARIFGVSISKELSYHTKVPLLVLK